MPRNFFHTFNGHPYRDEQQGTDFPGFDEARQIAVRTAGEIIRSDSINAWKGSDWDMAVTDAAGHPVLWLRFTVEAKSGKGI
jgi:hypothetical protein